MPVEAILGSCYHDGHAARGEQPMQTLDILSVQRDLLISVIYACQHRHADALLSRAASRYCRLSLQMPCIVSVRRIYYMHPEHFYSGACRHERSRYSMAVRFSARNQLHGTVKSVKLGEVMAEVIVELPDGQQIV